MRYVISKIEREADEMAYRFYVTDGLQAIVNFYGYAHGLKQDAMPTHFHSVVSHEKKQTQEEQEVNAEEIKRHMMEKFKGKEGADE